MKRTEKLGDRFTWPIPLVRLDGSAIDPTGCSVIFTAKLKPNSQADDAAAFQKSLAFGIATTGDAIAGYVAHVDVLPLDTIDLAPGSLSCEVQVQSLVDPDEVASTATYTLALVRDVTRETVTSVDIHTEQAPAPVMGFDYIPMTAAVALGGGRFLALDPTGGCIYADAASGLPACGFTRAAVAAAAVVQFRQAGSLNGLAGLTPGATYYLAGNGLISATAPGAGLIQSLGVASAPDTLLVEIGEPVEVPV